VERLYQFEVREQLRDLSERDDPPKKQPDFLAIRASSVRVSFVCNCGGLHDELVLFLWCS
jgi:hypothetical protein